MPKDKDKEDEFDEFERTHKESSLPIGIISWARRVAEEVDELKELCKELNKQLTDARIELAALKARVVIFGAICAGIPTIIMFLLTYLKKGP